MALPGGCDRATSRDRSRCGDHDRHVAGRSTTPNALFEVCTNPVDVPEGRVRLLHPWYATLLTRPATNGPHVVRLREPPATLTPSLGGSPTDDVKHAYRAANPTGTPARDRHVLWGVLAVEVLGIARRSLEHRDPRRNAALGGSRGRVQRRMWRRSDATSVVALHAARRVGRVACSSTHVATARRARRPRRLR